MLNYRSAIELRNCYGDSCFLDILAKLVDISFRDCELNGLPPKFTIHMLSNTLNQIRLRKVLDDLEYKDYELDSNLYDNTVIEITLR